MASSEYHLVSIIQQMKSCLLSVHWNNPCLCSEINNMNTLPYPFSESNLGIEFTLNQACHSLSELKNWSERYRQLFILANRITPLDEQWRVDSNLVEECESPVWLIHHYDLEQQKHYFLADSNSKIIKGLLVLILCSCNGQSKESIATIQLEPLLKQLDFGKYLTPSRSNGLLSVMAKIQAFCLI